MNDFPWKRRQATPRRTQQLREATPAQTHEVSRADRSNAVFFLLLTPPNLLSLAHFATKGDLIDIAVQVLAVYVCIWIAVIFELKYRSAGRLILLESELLRVRGRSQDRFESISYDEIRSVECVGTGGCLACVTVTLESGQSLELTAGKAWARHLQALVSGADYRAPHPAVADHYSIDAAPTNVAP